MIKSMQIAPHYIQGEWVNEGDTAEVTNPANGECIGHYHMGSAPLVARATTAARAAFEQTDWANNHRRRASILLQFANQMKSMREELIKLVTYENGKVMMQAAMEIDICISELEYYAGLARNLFGRMTEVMPENMSLLAKEPSGVAAIIVPWNAPATLLIRSLAPAMAAGCTSVIKPAPQTPLINHKILQCLDKIDDLPSGVVNSVNENGIIVGQTLAESHDVDVISFTGSSQTGKRIMASASDTLKTLSLELGGKAPSLIFPDANIDKTIAGITQGITILSGQMCVAISRVLVHESLAQEIGDKLTKSLASVKVGPGYNPASQMGAIIDKQNQQRLMNIIDNAAQEGDMLLKGQPPADQPSEGSFLTPTLFVTEDTSSDLVQQEHFGPIASLETFHDDEEAIAKANATEYGLSASLWSQNINRAFRVSKKIRSGTVWVNCHSKLTPESETGGFKQSGLGRLHGVEGLNDFMETKNIFIDITE